MTTTPPVARRLPAEGSQPALEPSSYDELRDCILAAEAAGGTLVPAGLGNHLPRPIPPGARVLSLKKLRAVLRYEPGDFTIGVQAGLPLDELQATLAENGQEVPVDFARSPRGTIGGALAQNRAGPRRGRYGTLRPYLIGVAGMRGGGRLYKAGGMVVKNVAGYDVMKLLLGSRGALGPILEVNLKLRPLPAARWTKVWRFASAGEAWRCALEVRRLALEPSVLSILNPGASAALDRAIERAPAEAWTLLCAFEGNRGAVDWQAAAADRVAAHPAGDSVSEGRLNAESSLLDERAWLAARELLCAAREPAPGEEGEVLCLSLSALPTEGGPLQEALDGAVRAVMGGSRGKQGDGAADGKASCWTIADASSGLHVVRAAAGLDAPRDERGRGKSGSKQKEKEAAPMNGGGAWPAALLERTAEIARRFRGVGQIVSAPASLSPELIAGRALSGETGTALDERVRAAFDPRRVFAAASYAPAAVTSTVTSEAAKTAAEVKP